MQSIDSHLIISEIAGEYRKELNHHVFRGIHLNSLLLSKMFQNLNERYQRISRRSPVLNWLQEQKKLYQCFLLVYCHLNLKKILEITQPEWVQISNLFGGKNILLLKYEGKILEKSQERVKWTTFQQNLLGDCTRGSRELKWAEISRYLFFQSQGINFKTPKQCREHWNNHMNREITHGAWTIEEDLIILDLVLQQGRKWAKISLQLQNRRTQHMIKNRFHTLLTCAKHLLKNKPESKNSQTQIIRYFQRILMSKKQKQQGEYQNQRNFRLKQNIKLQLGQQNLQHKCQVKQQAKDVQLELKDKREANQEFLNVSHQIIVPETTKNDNLKKQEKSLKYTTFKLFPSNEASSELNQMNFPYLDMRNLNEYPFMKMTPFLTAPFPSQPFPIFHP